MLGRWLIFRMPLPRSSYFFIASYRLEDLFRFELVHLYLSHFLSHACL